ncbi:hypothetical protein C2G38_2246467 [Gigaspora rosea]|uniref:BTB domain-containing protein n=1 Tax=Gigaspora rosea TaxID=44941 RepID=A0A397V5H2_9GLOM|nr:hypothetical protein C2G38_2246467 [Gigaspora rosea]
MAIKHLEKLSNSYIELLEKGNDFNVIIKVGKSTDIKEFKTHSAILKCRSSYFQNKLENITKDTNGIINIDLKSHISIQQFEIIIKYIYGGFVSLENLDTQFIFDLILVADEFLLDELIESLEIYLIESEAHWLRSHFVHIYKTCFQNNKLKELQKWCNNILVKYPNLIFDSEDFNSLNEDALVSLIKRDDLQTEEIKIWNYVIKWGIAQNPDLPSNPEDWSDENFTVLKDTLKNCLPHIRYFQISGRDVADYVLPYSQILEKKLWIDLNKSILSSDHQVTSTILPPRIILKPELPTRSTEPLSTVINEEHAAEIASWIDKNTTAYNTKNNPYEFKLLLRGSRDGFNRESFWNLCNMKANTVTVINVKGNNDNIERILGGYNPIAWDKSKNGSYGRCKDSFIFSLKNSTFQNSILSRISKPEYAIYFSSNCGVNFGGGHLSTFANYNEQNNGCNTAYCGWYETPIDSPYIGQHFPTKNNKRTTKANINKFDTLRDLSDSGDYDDSDSNNIQNWFKNEGNRPLEDLKVDFNVWQMSKAERIKLHDFWKEEVHLDYL